MKKIIISIIILLGCASAFAQQNDKLLQNAEIGTQLQHGASTKATRPQAILHEHESGRQIYPRAKK